MFTAMTVSVLHGENAGFPLVKRNEVAFVLGPILQRHSRRGLASNLLLKPRRCVRPRADAADAVTSSQVPVGNVKALPSTTTEIVDQAYESCSRAWEAGVTRQRVELLLPLIGGAYVYIFVL